MWPIMIIGQVQVASMSQQKECRRCGYMWESRAEVPVQCPRCKSPKWDETPSQSQAHYIVAKAIRKGELAPLDGTIACMDCGEPATAYDHRDYAYPLNVEPVCHSCNLKRGKGENRQVEGKLVRIPLSNREFAKIKYHAEIAGKTLAEAARIAMVEWIERQDKED
jgi:hypothetical protein